MIRLLELRTREGLTQRDVAKALFVSQGTYNNWENGKTEPSIEQLIALSQFFGEPIDYIVNNEIENKDKIIEKQNKKREVAKGIEKIEDELKTLKESLLNI